MTSDQQPIRTEVLPERISEDAYIALKKLEYDHALARVGLQGTLWGAWAALFTLLVIVLMPVFSSKTVVDGWKVVALVAVFVIPVMFYGSFVFSHALKISAKIDKTGTGTIETGGEPAKR